MTDAAAGARASGDPRLTILVVARDAASTIARAIRSALLQEPASIVLVDDASEDETVAVARSTADARLRIERLDAHTTVGHARNVALALVETPFGMWLDADDELLPGRARRLLDGLETEGTDLAADAAELVDQATGTVTGLAAIPPFLVEPPGLVRLFERSYLPAPGPIAFRTAALRPLGYDAQLQGAEDVDFLLRAVASGRRGSLVPEIGYRVYTSPASLSRQLTNQRTMLRRALEKHCYEEVERLYLEQGSSDYVARWGLVWLATFREDWGTALALLDRVAALGLDLGAVVEPAGPCPRREAWRQNFQRGTLLLMLGRPIDAALALASADAVEPTAESANNLGVALSRIGRDAGARECFARALGLWPGYLDARLNAAAAVPDRITTHPLRVHRARSDYARL